MKTIKISPTKKASQRTKNRIREHGPTFQFVQERNSSWLLKAGEWFGWLRRSEFCVDWVGPSLFEKKFIKKVLG